MNTTILEFKIKKFQIKIDTDEVIILNQDEIILRAKFQEIKVASLWIFNKVKELMNDYKQKQLEQKE